MLLAGRAVAHDNARQAVLALEADEEILEGEKRKDQPAGLVRDEFLPVRARRVGDRRRHDLEVLGAVGIGEDEEDVAAFLQVVLQPGLPWPPPASAPPSDRRS